MSRRTELRPVAVVVFVNAEGVDPHDSANVGAMAVGHHLGMSGGGRGRIDVTTRAGERAVAVVGVMELTAAGRNGLVLPAASEAAFKS